MKDIVHVSIVIVNWNGKEDTLHCLASLMNLTTDTNVVKKITVVDNGSQDNSVQEIQKKYPTCEVLPLKDNIGFTGANNCGIKKAISEKADYVWILNNDTTVDMFALKNLIKPFEQNNVGITASKIYFMKGREYHFEQYKESDRGNVIWYAGGKIDWKNVYGSHRGVDEIDRGQYDTIEKTVYASGCSFCISRSCLEKIGYFDERYFAYLEDMDLSLRAETAGFAVLYIPQSKVWHKNAASTSRPGNDTQQYYMTRNRFLFGLTYASARTKFALLRESFRFVIRGTKTQKRAIIDAIVGRWGKKLN